jgi:hypothetical protein
MNFNEYDLLAIICIALISLLMYGGVLSVFTWILKASKEIETLIQ